MVQHELATTRSPARSHTKLDQIVEHWMEAKPHPPMNGNTSSLVLPLGHCVRTGKLSKNNTSAAASSPSCIYEYDFHHVDKFSRAKRRDKGVFLYRSGACNVE